MEKDTKSAIIKEFAKNEKDVGSSEVQVAVLTEKIKELTGHMQRNKKDVHSRKGLIGMVNRRKKLLKYLAKKNHDSYIAITDKLKIKRK